MNQAINQTSYYIIANIIRQMTALVMLPIYTRYLTPGDYGIYELMTIALDLVGILVCNRIGEAIFRYYTMAKSSSEKTRTISTAFFLAILINTLGFMLIMLASKSISDFINPEPDFHRLFILFAVTLILEAVTSIPIIYLRMQNLAKYYLFVSVIRLSIQVSLNIYFVVIKDLHVEGIVYSVLVTNIIMAVILGTYFLSRNGIHFDRQIAYKIFVFSIPMLFVASASFVTTFGDRYFLKLYTNLHDVGIYSLAYKFGFIFVALGWDPFFKYWEGERYRLYRSGEAKSQFGKSFLYLNLWLVTLGTLISVFLGDLLYILSDEKFHRAADYAPLIILAYIFYAWSHFCGFGIYLKEKPRFMAYAEIFGAIIIFSLYFLLIPTYGILGASVATALGYFARFLIVTLVSFSLYHMELPWLRVSTILMVCTLIVYLLSFIDLNIYLSIPLKMLVISGLFLLIYLSPLVAKSEKEDIRQTFIMLKSKLVTTLQSP